MSLGTNRASGKWPCVFCASVNPVLPMGTFLTVITGVISDSADCSYSPLSLVMPQMCCNSK